MKKIIFIIVIILLLGAMVAQANGKIWWNPSTWFSASSVATPELIIGEDLNNDDMPVKITEKPKQDPAPEPVLPSQNTSTKVSGKLGETISMFGGKATITELVEDSRCPKDAQCIWAGTVKVKIHVVYGIISKDIVLTLNDPYTVQGYSATLTEVFPDEPNSQTSKFSYVFTFSLKSPK